MDQNEQTQDSKDYSLLEATPDKDSLTPVQYSSKPTEKELIRQIEELSDLFQTKPKPPKSQQALAELRELANWLNRNPKIKLKGMPK